MTPLRYYSMIVGGGVAAVAAGTVYWIRSHRKTYEQRERERRLRLALRGRITDGNLLDVQQYSNDGQPPMHLLIYSYDIAGVSYECSQDVTHLPGIVDIETCKLGVPASIKYDPQNPGDSIVVSEEWSGLRI
jgi:hypothetical protein